MNNWQPYPQNQPENTNEAKQREYAVLVPNPRRINKKGYGLNLPQYQVYLALWLGDGFVDEQIQPLSVHYFLTLPSHS